MKTYTISAVNPNHRTAPLYNKTVSAACKTDAWEMVKKEVTKILQISKNGVEINIEEG